jgi:hypothetical protein
VPLSSCLVLIPINSSRIIFWSVSPGHR